MSGVGPAMDMAMEAARGERAPVPADVPAPKATQAASMRDAHTSLSAIASNSDLTGVSAASATRAEAPPPNATMNAPAATVPATAAVGTRIAADAMQPAPSAEATPDAVPTAPATDATAGITPATASAAVTTHTIPAKTFATTQAARPTPAASPADAGSLGGTVFALLLVIGLILALGWLARRMPGFGRNASTNGLRMVASLPIGARERVVVVEVGTTQLLLGVGPGGTRTLHTLDAPLPEAGPAQAPQFAQLLAQHFGKKA